MKRTLTHATVAVPALFALVLALGTTEPLPASSAPASPTTTSECDKDGCDKDGRCEAKAAHAAEPKCGGDGKDEDGPEKG